MKILIKFKFTIICIIDIYNQTNPYILQSNNKVSWFVVRVSFLKHPVTTLISCLYRCSKNKRTHYSSCYISILIFAEEIVIVGTCQISTVKLWLCLMFVTNKNCHDWLPFMETYIYVHDTYLECL